MRSSPGFEQHIGADLGGGNCADSSNNIVADNDAADNFAAVVGDDFAPVVLRLVQQAVQNVLRVQMCRVRESLLDLHC